MEWKLYHKDGTPLRDTNGKEISVHSLTYDGEWMGECSVSVSIENEAPVDFSIGDYLIYRNERFELNYDPGKAKQGRKNALGNSFKYPDIKLPQFGITECLIQYKCSENTPPPYAIRSG